MTNETENLVLEHLRAIRAEQAAMRSEVDRRFAALDDRMDRLENEMRGVSYIVTVAIGTLVSDISDIKKRVSALEKRTNT